MDLICASICFRGHVADEVAGTLAQAPGMGYRLMEVHGPRAWSVAAIAAFDLPGLERDLAAAGMQCAGIYAPNWGGVDAADVSRRAQAVARCVELVTALGGSHVATSGAEPRGTPGALERVVACAREVLALVPADSPVKLALEPHYGNVLQEPEDFRRVLGELPDPRLGLCVDTGHFHSAGVDTVALIHEFAPRVYNVHLKDHVGPVSVGIGRGEIDLPAILQALRDVNYAGDLTIELEVEDPENLPQYTREAYLYLAGMLGRKL